MYTFAPVPALGGETRAVTAIIEKAVPHLLLLASMQGADVMGDIVATLKQRESAVDDWVDDDQS